MSPTRCLALLLALSLSSCIIHIDDGGGEYDWTDSFRRQGSGTRVSQTRSCEEFKRLRLALGANVHLVAGSAAKLELSGDDNLLEHVRTRVVDGELVIDSDGELLRFREGLRVELTTQALEGVTLAGNGRLELLNLSGERFEASLQGSGEIVARGKLERATLSVSGSGELHCRELEVQDLQVSISGSAQAHVRATQRLSISISGSGDVRYGGTPAQITRSIAGSGTIAPE